MDARPALEPADGGSATHVRVRAQPGARRRGWLATRDGELCLGVQAPPEDGRANEELVALVAELCALRARDVALVRGARGRHKVLRVALAPAEVARRLAAHGGAGPDRAART